MHLGRLLPILMPTESTPGVASRLVAGYQSLTHCRFVDRVRSRWHRFVASRANLSYAASLFLHHLRCVRFALDCRQENYDQAIKRSSWACFMFGWVGTTRTLNP